MIVEYPAMLKPRVIARMQNPLNLGKIIWVERGEDGTWYVHANTAREANRRMSMANLEGRFHALAAEVLK
jgi:hypothetical protein